MLKNKYVFILSILFVAATSYYFANKSNVPSKVKKEAKVINLKKSDLKDFPTVVIEVIESKDKELKGYKSKIEAISKDAQFHKDLGQRLYTLSMSNGFYSNQKLQLLQMAKEHLIVAKERGAK